MNELNETLSRIEELLKDLKKESIKSEILTQEDCATLLGVSTTTLYKMAHMRELPYYKHSNRRLYFKRSEVEAYLLSEDKRQATEDEIQTMAATHCATHRR